MQHKSYACYSTALYILLYVLFLTLCRCSLTWRPRDWVSLLHTDTFSSIICQKFNQALAHSDLFVYYIVYQQLVSAWKSASYCDITCPAPLNTLEIITVYFSKRLLELHSRTHARSLTHSPPLPSQTPSDVISSSWRPSAVLFDYAQFSLISV